MFIDRKILTNTASRGTMDKVNSRRTSKDDEQVQKHLYTK